MLQTAGFQGFTVPVLTDAPPVEQGGDEPTLPANAVVGQAAAKMISWGGQNYLWSVPAATFATWKSWGYAGHAPKLAGSGTEFAYAPGYTTMQQDLMATSAVPVDINRFQYQRASEGYGGGAFGTPYANTGPFEFAQADPSSEAWFGVYMRDRLNSPLMGQPMGDWFDDARWATYAAFWARSGLCMKNVLQGDGFAFDVEYNDWRTPYGGHTLEQMTTKAEQRGYEMGAALWQNFPDAKIGAYAWHPRGLYGEWLRGWWNYGDTRLSSVGFPPKSQDIGNQWMAGWIRAMGDHGSANARVGVIDADFYKPNEGGGAMNGERGAKAKVGIEWVMATWSGAQYGLGPTVWSKVCDRVAWHPFSWASEAPTNPQAWPLVSPAAFAEQLGEDRVWGMDGHRWIYEFNYGSPGGGFPYSPDYLPGMQAADNPAPISTVVPTVTNLSWTGSTLTCRAAHYYGVWNVKVYNGGTFDAADPEASYLGAATMTWTHPSLPDYVGTSGKNGGAPGNSNITLARVADTYQQCSFTTSGAIGDWRVVRVMSAKRDVTWVKVQRTA